MKKKRKRKLIHRLLIVALIVLLIWTVWSNFALEATPITIIKESLPQSFDGFKIALVSDLHNARFGNNNEKLIKILEDAKPDLIAITGDVIDSRRTDVSVALEFASRAAKVAPCYYVSGNHEGLVSDAEYQRLKTGFEEIGVIILEDREEILEVGGEKISLIGIDDPLTCKNGGIALNMNAQELDALNSLGGFSILLSHRPEFFETYAEAGVDIVLSGHVHGGQFRLPFVGGLYSPSQGFFPEYDAGVFSQDGTDMVVSRGLGNSLFPIRFNNRPEVVIIELKTEQ
ncbi:MAG: metallophosphoesterase [Clostridia bacterium]|nr:metallophosphoesterase [Clostridia bacterium]